MLSIPFIALPTHSCCTIFQADPGSFCITLFRWYVLTNTFQRKDTNNYFGSEHTNQMDLLRHPLRRRKTRLRQDQGLLLGLGHQPFGVSQLWVLGLGMALVWQDVLLQAYQSVSEASKMSSNYAL